MRIISEHRDYYDCVQSQGQDQTCVWVRKLEKVELNKWPFPVAPCTYRYFKREDIFIKEYIVGFCGSIYPILIVSKNDSDDGLFCCNLEEFDAFIENSFKQKLVDVYYNPRKGVSRLFRDGVGVERKDVKKFFDECSEKQKSYSQIFLDNTCPIFVARFKYPYRNKEKSTIIYHGRRDTIDDETRILTKDDVPLLKDLQFFRTIDPYTAFQEIHMYMGGVLGFNNPHVPTPDDKTMLGIKGFDEWSFKKEPTKNK